jgi:hypothetical protein
MKQTLILNFQASEIPITEDDVLSMIGESKLSEIKKTDEKPSFAAYVVGQEGTSNPKILDGGQKPMQWLKSSISKMVSAIQNGTKLFHGHNKDNSTEGRESFGEVVASTEREVNGKNTAIIVCHVDPKKKDFVKKQDIISIEAITEVFETAKEYIVDTVEAVKGFAIGSSDTWSPGIPGARQLLMVQAMAADTAELTKVGNTMEVTFEQVKQFITERKVFPSQLYKAHEIFGAPVKRKDGTVYYQGGDRVLQDDANEFLNAVVQEKTLEIAKQKEEIEIKAKDIEDKYKTVYQKTAQLEFIPEIEKAAKDKKYPETALKLLKLETKGIEIPEDSIQREALKNQILATVEEKHKELFGGSTQQEEKSTVASGQGNANPGSDNEETF